MCAERRSGAVLKESAISDQNDTEFAIWRPGETKKAEDHMHLALSQYQPPKNGRLQKYININVRPHRFSNAHVKQIMMNRDSIGELFVFDGVLTSRGREYM